MPLPHIIQECPAADSQARYTAKLILLLVLAELNSYHFRNLAHDKHYLRGFAFDRALEHLTMHPFFSSKKPAEAGGEVALSRYQAFIVA